MKIARHVFACAVMVPAFLLPVRAEKLPAKDTEVKSHVSGPWLKLYTLEPYAQYWHVHIQVKDLNQSLPKILKALKSAGGEPVLPIANMAASPSRGYQQLSYHFSIHSADKAVGKLRKLGTVDMMMQYPASWNPGTLQEAQSKLRELKGEMTANQDSLKQMPAIYSLASELADHLAQVETTFNLAKDRVLINVEIQQERSRP